MRFSPKQAGFVAAYSGNIRETAAAAGLTYGYARQLMMSPQIRDAIEKRGPAPAVAKAFRTRQSRQSWWAAQMADETLPMQHRLRASELLAKSEGDFLERKESDEGGLILRLDFGKVAEARARNATKALS